MPFFKSMWKNNSKHKKLCEEWALATSLKDFNDPQDDLDDDTEPVSFTIKYLGNTTIESARSEEATADAVKTVISTAKANGKKLQRVNLTVSPKGIEIFDLISGEAIQRISIYRISYCSADATHDHVFAFVSSSIETEDGFDQLDPANGPSSNTEGTLECHAFLCSKRKIAQSVALTVARSFERAYQLWQVTSERRKLEMKRKNKENKGKSLEATNNDNNVRSLLIDFNSELTSELCSKDHRAYFQNTWVSFDDNDANGNNEVPLLSKLHEKSWEANMLCS